MELLLKFVFVFAGLAVILAAYFAVDKLAETAFARWHWRWALVALVVIFIPYVIPGTPFWALWLSYGLCLFFGVIFFEQNRRKKQQREQKTTQPTDGGSK